MRTSSPAHEALGAQEPVTFIDANGVRLAAMRRGRGQPIVCLHAIAHGARDFEELAARVGDAFEIIALDWPGHGLSPHDGHAPDAAHYGDVLSAALDALQLEKPVLLGCSIGGAAALRVAAGRPEKIAGLVLRKCGRPTGDHAGDTGLAHCTDGLVLLPRRRDTRQEMVRRRLPVLLYADGSAARAEHTSQAHHRSWI